MVRNLIARFEDKEFEKIKELKGDLSWEDFIKRLITEKRSDVKNQRILKADEVEELEKIIKKEKERSIMSLHKDIIEKWPNVKDNEDLKTMKDSRIKQLQTLFTLEKKDTPIDDILLFFIERYKPKK